MARSRQNVILLRWQWLSIKHMKDFHCRMRSYQFPSHPKFPSECILTAIHIWESRCYFVLDAAVILVALNKLLYLLRFVYSLSFWLLICSGYEPVYRASRTWGRPCQSRVTCFWELGDEFDKSVRFQNPITLSKLLAACNSLACSIFTLVCSI